MTEDDQLMIRIQSGDLRAFDELVEKYQGPLIGFFFRNCRDSQRSEDLSQETLLRVYNQAWNYLPQGRFRGWMYRVARNLLIDSIRRQSHDALIKAYTGKQADDEDSLNRLACEVISPELNKVLILESMIPSSSSCGVFCNVKGLKRSQSFDNWNC